jgi:hypothetical protein
VKDQETNPPAPERAKKLALSRIEAAHALSVSPMALDRFVKRGQLHPSRATRRPLFPIWELERFLRETMSTATVRL